MGSCGGNGCDEKEDTESYLLLSYLWLSLAMTINQGDFMNKVIQAAISELGSQKKLADACGVAQPTVWAWLHCKKNVSAENAKSIEIATAGKIQAYQVRPDLKDLFPHPEQTA